MTDTHNNSTDKSPCLTCERKDLNKTDCSIICPRLATYRSGEPWQDVEIAKITEKYDGTEELGAPKSRAQEKICAIEGCNKPVYCRGLSQIHYNQWRLGYIEHPVYGKFAVSQPKKNKLPKAPAKKSKPRKVVKKPESFPPPPKTSKRPAIIRLKLRFSKYPELQEIVYSMSKKLHLPVQHIIMTLISEAIANKKDKDRQR